MKRPEASATRAFCEAVLSAAGPSGARFDNSGCARRNGRNPGVNTGPRTYIGHLGYLRGADAVPWVRMYWRTEMLGGTSRLECSVALDELPQMAVWCVQYLQAVDAGRPWPEPPVPVDAHLEEYGAACRYMWSNGGLRAYYADPRTLKGPLDGSARDKRPIWLQQEASGKPKS